MSQFRRRVDGVGVLVVDDLDLGALLQALTTVGRHDLDTMSITIVHRPLALK